MIREDKRVERRSNRHLSASDYRLHRGFLPFLLATSVTPRARPQELVSSERELARRVVTRARNTTRGSPSSHEAEPSRDEKRFRHTDRLIARRTLFSFSFFFFSTSPLPLPFLTSILEASFFPPARTWNLIFFTAEIFDTGEEAKINYQDRNNLWSEENKSNFFSSTSIPNGIARRWEIFDWRGKENNFFFSKSPLRFSPRREEASISSASSPSAYYGKKTTFNARLKRIYVSRTIIS